MLFKVEDQYGRNMAAAGVGYSTMVVNMSPGTTGLAMQQVNYNGSTLIQSINPIMVGNTEYLAYPLQPPANGLKQGIAYITAYAVGSSANVKVTLNVGAKQGIKTFTLSPTETAYEAKDTYLNYSIVDTSGNNVTDYATLVKYCDLSDAGSFAQFPKKSLILASSNDATFAWEKQEDGSAKLRYTPAVVSTSTDNNTGVAYMDLISTMSGSVNYKMLNLNVYKKPVPVRIYGIRSDATLGALQAASSSATGGEVALRLRDLQVMDQYGADMSPELLKSSGYSFTISGTAGDSFKDLKVSNVASGSGISTSLPATASVPKTSVDDLENATGIYTKLISMNTTEKSGTSSLTIALNNGSTAVSNSSYTFTMRSVAKNDLLRSSYKVENLGTLYNGDSGEYLFEVSGTTADGTRLIIPQSDIFVYGVGVANQFLDVTNGSISVIRPAEKSLAALNYPLNSSGYRSAEFKFSVVVDDGYGTTVDTAVTISDEAPRAVSLKASQESFNINKNQTVWEQIGSQLTATDQYGRMYSISSNSGTDAIRVLLSYGSDVTVTSNGTVRTKVTGGTGTVTARIFVNNINAITLTLNITG